MGPIQDLPSGRGSPAPPPGGGGAGGAASSLSRCRGADRGDPAASSLFPAGSLFGGWLRKALGPSSPPTRRRSRGGGASAGLAVARLRGILSRAFLSDRIFQTQDPGVRRPPWRSEGSMGRDGGQPALWFVQPAAAPKGYPPPSTDGSVRHPSVRPQAAGAPPADGPQGGMRRGGGPRCPGPTGCGEGRRTKGASQTAPPAFAPSRLPPCGNPPRVSLATVIQPVECSSKTMVPAPTGHSAGFVVATIGERDTPGHCRPSQTLAEKVEHHRFVVDGIIWVISGAFSSFLRRSPRNASGLLFALGFGWWRSCFQLYQMPGRAFGSVTIQAPSCSTPSLSPTPTEFGHPDPDPQTRVAQRLRVPGQPPPPPPPP